MSQIKNIQLARKGKHTSPPSGSFGVKYGFEGKAAKTGGFSLC